MQWKDWLQLIFSSLSCNRHRNVLSTPAITHGAVENPCVSPKDTNKLTGMTEMKSAETQPSRSPHYGKQNNIFVNNIS